MVAEIAYNTSKTFHGNQPASTTIQEEDDTIRSLGGGNTTMGGEG